MRVLAYCRAQVIQLERRLEPLLARSSSAATPTAWVSAQISAHLVQHPMLATAEQPEAQGKLVNLPSTFAANQPRNA
jgi:hypothetical protein